MKTSLIFGNVNHPRFLKQIILNLSANYVPFSIKEDAHILAKSTRVLISNGFAIAKGLQNWISS
jgi:hypothetical protein